MYWSVDNPNIAWDHRNIEGSKLSTYISALIFVWLLGDEYTVYYITTYTNRMLDRSFNDDLKIESLFGIDWSFRRSLQSITFWWLGKLWRGCCWACGPTFRGELKKLAAKKALKIKDCNLCTKWNVCRKYQVKMRSLNLKLG